MGRIQLNDETALTEAFIREKVVKPGLKPNISDEALTSPQLYRKEARRRGWRVEQVDKRVYSFFAGNHQMGALNQVVTSLASMPAVTICNQKHLTRKALELNGLSIAEGNNFDVSDLDGAIEYFRDFGRPVVVKPADGSMGAGVTANILTEAELQTAWHKAAQTTKKGAQIIIEEYLSGFDIRAYVVGGKMVAACTRIPPFVIGDGSTTLGQLVDLYRTQRSANAYIRSLPLMIDHQWLQFNGWADDTVLADGQIALLNLTSNTHQGGASFDITNLLSPSLVNLAQNAATAIPGLGAVGIDLYVQSLDTAQNAVVLEANVSASLLLHHYATFGTQINVARAVLDHMEFVAETKS